MSNNGVRLQPLRDFTVQIRHTRTDEIVGTGFVVSFEDGYIVTCGHVLLAAGINPKLNRPILSRWALLVESIRGGDSDSPSSDGDADVGVYFPQVRRVEDKTHRARLFARFPDHDEDVVLLQLVDGPPPINANQIAKLGRAENAFEHPFRSYGYHRLDKYKAGHARGTIVGDVEPSVAGNFLIDPIELESNSINLGMSGAAVLDVEQNLVVGIISETWLPEKDYYKEQEKKYGTAWILKNQNKAWAVNARVLSLEPLNLPLRDEPLERLPTRQPSETEQTAAKETTELSFPLDPKFHNAPPSLGEEWAGRTNLLQAITADWADPERRVTGLIGFGGEGKSSLARRWLGDVVNQRLADCGPCPAPDGVFW